MGYVLRNGSLVKVEKVKRRKPVREEIKTTYHRELWNPGPVQDMARAIAKQQFLTELRRKGKDTTELSPKEIDNGVTVLLFNSGAYFLNKAKEALR